MAKLVRESAIKLSERDIERTCTDLLALDGWRCLKTDPVSRREWGKGFGEKGMADCLYIRYSSPDVPPSFSTHTPETAKFDDWPGQDQVIWIEWKRPSGKVADHQKQWHLTERKRGAVVWVAGEDFSEDYDSFLAFYRASGLNRRV